MAALETVEEYITAARILLQDRVEPYRYPDDDLLLALNTSFLEARKLRSDLFIGRDVPSYDAIDSTDVEIDEQYRMAFVHYIVGTAQLRDGESDTDARAAAFLAQFTGKLLTIG